MIRYVWYFYNALGLVVKAVCGSFGSVLLKVWRDVM
ncbi:DUF3265 domain-containing protein [Vibrio coralliilyticus]|nr:DUF3265 domain-containing protein [Vibrio coralliilyticus]NOI75347.1 DUF3265 domain-containing protein [Vibrio coralliilyticus]